MQGYGTLSIEADRQLLADGCECPTHIFIQAGVGSLAASVVGYFANKYKGHEPIMCCRKVCRRLSVPLPQCQRRQDIRCKGKLDTIMEGLPAANRNTIGWDILRNHAAGFAGCPDWMSAKGTRMYGVPLAEIPTVISGERFGYHGFLVNPELSPV